MVRSPATLRTSRRLALADSLLDSRKLLRGLIDENMRLAHELEDLRRLQKLAQLDAAGGVPNRRLCEQRLAKELSPWLRTAARPGTLLVVDVKELTGISPRQGPTADADGWRETARLLRGALRVSDQCYRTGDAEFMILLPDTDARGARQVMARLRAAVMRAGARQDVSASISMGAATWPTDGRAPRGLVAKADRAMSTEKRHLAARDRRPPVFGRRRLALVK